MSRERFRPSALSDACLSPSAASRCASVISRHPMPWRLERSWFIHLRHSTSSTGNIVFVRCSGVSAARNAAAAARTGYVDTPLAARWNNPGCTVPPPAFQHHLSRGRRPRVPLRRSPATASAEGAQVNGRPSPPPSCARHVQAALCRAPPGCRSARRVRQAPRARRGRRWGARVRGQRKKLQHGFSPGTAA